ncbi:PREDICTED: eukaryotic translation initiation factor 3 subunit K-like, partial [Acropora digitifera]|uniref:eukaryotic translation initiation factor 3 subunit K-like n=1 Tax=Acropora digitifera TaxID=70779 RepID=UPI00077B210A
YGFFTNVKNYYCVLNYYSCCFFSDCLYNTFADVSYVIGITYQTIDKSLMSDLLGGLQGDELDEWIKAQGWTIQEDGKVFICNQEAHIKSKNIAEKIDFECVAEIIASAK